MSINDTIKRYADEVDADSNARKQRIMDMLDDVRDLAVDAGATVVTSDLIVSIEEDEDFNSDAAADEFSSDPTTNVDGYIYQNLIDVCRHSALAFVG